MKWWSDTQKLGLFIFAEAEAHHRTGQGFFGEKSFLLKVIYKRNIPCWVKCPYVHRHRTLLSAVTPSAEQLNSTHSTSLRKHCIYTEPTSRAHLKSPPPGKTHLERRPGKRTCVIPFGCIALTTILSGLFYSGSRAPL